MWTEGCELSVRADVCQRTFSPELANSMCAFSCRTALNAGAGLAWPLLEGANCVETGGALSWRFARVYWVLVHADCMESSRNDHWKSLPVVCFPVNAGNGRSEPKEKRLASFNTRGKPIGPCCLSHMEEKINYGHYWRCYNIANDHQRGRCKWCINPARCCKRHFTTQ